MLEGATFTILYIALQEKHWRLCFRAGGCNFYSYVHTIHYITSKAREVAHRGDGGKVSLQGVLPFFHLKVEIFSLLNLDRKKLWYSNGAARHSIQENRHSFQSTIHVHYPVAIVYTGQWALIRA